MLLFLDMDSMVLFLGVNFMLLFLGMDSMFLFLGNWLHLQWCLNLLVDRLLKNNLFQVSVQTLYLYLKVLIFLSKHGSLFRILALMLWIVTYLIILLIFWEIMLQFVSLKLFKFISLKLFCYRLKLFCHSLKLFFELNDWNFLICK